MRFEWDEAKNAENIRKHGIDFVDVSAMFGGPMLIELDEGEDYGEDRWIGCRLLASHCGGCCLDRTAGRCDPFYLSTKGYPI